VPISYWYALKVVKTFGVQSRKESWEVAGNAATVSSRLLEAARHLGGSLQGESDGLVEMKFGSRLNYRMLGVWSKPRKRPLVLRLKVGSGTTSSTSCVQVEAFSDPGWYASTALFRSMMDRQYDEAFRRLFDGLQNAIPAVTES
jgi:hypothetical protein